MPSIDNLARFFLLPELKLLSFKVIDAEIVVLEVEKKRAACEICPKCASPCSVSYGRKRITVRDEPFRHFQVLLKINKRRFYCNKCKKPFTEPVPGIMPRRRTTQRFRKALMKACHLFSNLSQVRDKFKVSNALVYQAVYEQLDLKLREYDHPWPTMIGIDEHFFSRRNGYTQFVTMFTDQSHKRLRAVVLGKDYNSLCAQLEHIPGRENVHWVSIDLADSYKSFVFKFFPNAQIVADKFHVLRLLTPHLIKRRKHISSSRMTSKAKRLLTCSSKKLDPLDRNAIWRFLDDYPELKEVYFWKERLHSFYRIKGLKRATIALEHMLADMEKSSLPEIQTLRRTLTRWNKEVLNYFFIQLTNARTEGYNCVAKLVQRRAFGYRSFENYRVRLLSACGSLSF